MESKRDYYQLLGISRDAGADEIKKAYRRFAMKYHPDRNAGDKEAEKKFKETQEAYSVLSDERKRAAYDQFGHAGVGGAAGSGDFNQGAGFGDIFDNIFGDIFSGGQSHARAYRGADLRYDLTLSLEQAVSGASVKIRIPKAVLCHSCNGSRVKHGSSPAVCKMCDGQGQVRMQQGFFSVQQTCPKCRGQGKIIDDPCPTCRGQGKVRKDKTISVKVPEGVDNDDRIRLTGEGEIGDRGGTPGDLYVHIRVEKHEIFTRDGSHLYCDVPINFATAVLGGALEVPTLKGRVRLKIPPETQSGKLFRLRGEGVRSVRNSSRGDLLCRVAIETPVNLNSKQKELLKQFEESMQADSKRHSPKSDSWLTGVKRFFDSII